MATIPKAVTIMQEKTSIVDADLIEIVDSAEANKSLKNKKVLASTLKSYIGVSNVVMYVYTINDWDISTIKAHSFTLSSVGILDPTKVLSWSVMIYSDDKSVSRLLIDPNTNVSATPMVPDGSAYIIGSIDTFSITVSSTSIFSGPDYNSATGERGKVLFWVEV